MTDDDMPTFFTDDVMVAICGALSTLPITDDGPDDSDEGFPGQEFDIALSSFCQGIPDEVIGQVLYGMDDTILSRFAGRPVLKSMRSHTVVII